MEEKFHFLEVPKLRFRMDLYFIVKINKINIDVLCPLCINIISIKTGVQKSVLKILHILEKRLGIKLYLLDTTSDELLNF
jgi:hypothetical protein